MLKTESETGELARFLSVRLLHHALPISLLILRKKPTVLQSTKVQCLREKRPVTPSKKDKGNTNTKTPTYRAENV